MQATGTRQRRSDSATGDPVTARLNHLFCNQGSNTWSDMGPYLYSGSGRTAFTEVYDYCSPDYKAASARGQVINHDYLKRVWDLEPFPPISLNLELLINAPGQTVWGTKLDGTVLPFYSAVPGFLWLTTEDWQQISAEADLAVTKAHASIDAAEMLIGATAWEASQTMKFLLDTSRRAIRVANDFKKLKFKRMKREIKSWKEYQDRYMELRYAARPVVFDMVSAAKVVTAPIGKMRKVYRASKHFSILHEDEFSAAVYPGIDTMVKRKLETRVSIRAGVLCDIERTYASIAGLSKLPETVLEVIPFGFIANWFCNLSETLAAHTPKGNVNELASWVVITRESLSTISTADFALAPGWYTQYTDKKFSIDGACSARKYEMVVSRTANPTLRTWPQVDINLNMYKLADLAIILRNILR